jgi:hypothetical protein
MCDDGGVSKEGPLTTMIVINDDLTWKSVINNMERLIAP